MSRHTLCNCPAGFNAAPERHASDCPGRCGAGKPIPPAVAEFAVAQLAQEHPQQACLRENGDQIGGVVKPRRELLELAEAQGAQITGKPDGSQAIEIVFSIQAWRAFDAALLAQQGKAVGDE